MFDHDIVREGRFVRVTIGSATREHQYRDEAAARKAYERLVMSKVAREKFLRARRRS